MEDFEKLGVFYLGRRCDPTTRQPDGGLLLYDSKDLVTHAVCIGMTGSGKTGLCIDLIEEALIDGVPALIVDPKGDLTNLLLTFPDLAAKDFEPWVNEEDAHRAGVPVTEFASQQAELWRKGLAEWGQSGDRIKKLRDSAEIVIYTPGSNAALPISILKSFAAPAEGVKDDADLLSERISTTTRSVLGLVGIEGDSLKSREHILVSKILDTLWKRGENAELGTLIASVQDPPFDRIGALTLESFYPKKERFELATAINNLLAAPGFDAWLTGDPLDIAALLRAPNGKPRAAILSIAHLDDSQRMFFVSLLLNELLGWVRSQSGTTSLRALLYMDEIFGFFPPVANPPSKAPLLTLLKQARAFGVGIVLATQNPVDLDYKGLSNTGTWFIGRLQTERDKDRVMDGLEGVAATAGGNFDRGKMSQIIAGLGKRIFLMNNVHEDAPVVFESRWALSYLRGPLTRSQIKELTHRMRTTAPSTVAVDNRAPSAARPEGRPPAAASGSAPPILPPDIPQYFVPVRGAAEVLVYQPMALGAATVRFVDAKKGLNASRDIVVLVPIQAGAVPVDWVKATAVTLVVDDLERSPQEGAAFTDLPDAASKPKTYAAAAKSFAAWVYGSQVMTLFSHPGSGQISKPEETERDFRARFDQAAREQRDASVEQLRRKYAPKQAALEERLRRGQQKLEKEKGDVSSSGMQAVISVGATMLGALFGRKAMSVSTLGRATTAARGAGRVLQQREDVGRAAETLEAVQQQIVDLEAQLKADLAELETKSGATGALSSVDVRPKKSDVTIDLVALAWAPYRRQPSGETTEAW